MFKKLYVDAIVEPLYIDMRKKISNSNYKIVISKIIKGLNMAEMEKLFDYILKQFQQQTDDGIYKFYII